MEEVDVLKGNFGYIPDPPDDRDALAGAFLSSDTGTADIILAQPNTNIKNQNGYPSCVGQALARLVEYANYKEDKPGDASGRYIYARAKQVDGYPNMQGTFFRVGLKILQTLGTPPEEMWAEKHGIPYADYAIAPPKKLDTAAAHHRIKGYFRLESPGQVKQYLAEERLPVLLGVNLTAPEWDYPAMDTHPKHNKYPIISDGDGKRYGHAILVVGVLDDIGYLLENSFDKRWGYNGRAILPFDYAGIQLGGMYAVYDLPNNWQDINNDYLVDMKIMKDWLKGVYKAFGWNWDSEAWSAARQQALQYNPEGEGFNFAQAVKAEIMKDIIAKLNDM